MVEYKKFGLCVYLKKVCEKDREEIQKIVNECKSKNFLRRLLRKCHVCDGLNLFEDEASTVLCFPTMNLIHTVRCVKKKIKKFKQIIKSYAIEVWLPLPSNLAFEKFKESAEIRKQIGEEIKKALISKGLNCVSVLIFSRTYFITFQFNELDEQEILKTLSCVESEKRTFETIMLSEVI